MTFALAVTGRHLYLTFGDALIEGAVQRHAWQEATP
jgi:hypothetical protein